MLVKVACAQPQSFRGDDERENLGTALRLIREAAATGAKLVTFPEGFPGPYHGPADWSPVPAIQEAAKEHEIHVVFGLVEHGPDGGYHLTLKLVDDQGYVRASYHRVQPNPPEVDHVLMNNKTIIPGESLQVIKTDLANIGLLICSEIWNPELVRVLALQGADIIVAPIGGMVYELAEAWRTIFWARAIENHVYMLTSQNLYGMEDGLAMIAGPESWLARRSDPGLITAELDLGRLRWLRSHRQSLGLPKPYKSIPGLLRYRRPEKYELLTAPQPDAYDFWYYRKLRQAQQGTG